MRARSLSRALFAIRDAARAGERRVPPLLEIGRGALEADSLDYLEIRDGVSLRPLDTLPPPGGIAPRALVAAVVGRTRLIDNTGL